MTSTPTLPDAARVERLAAEQAAADAAHDEERAAAAALLAAAIERVKPALRACASRVRLSLAQDNDALRGDEDRESWAPWRGVLVSCDPDVGAGPARQDGRDRTRYGYGGYDVFVADDGSIHELHYDGTGSQWQGEGHDWSAEDRVLAAVEAVDEYGANAVLRWIERLSLAIDRQLAGGRAAAARAATERAAKLRAIAALLR